LTNHHKIRQHELHRLNTIDRYNLESKMADGRNFENR